MVLNDILDHMEKFTEQTRMQKAGQSRVRRVTDRDIKIGDQVLIFHEEHSR